MKYETYQLIDICRFIDYRGKTPPKTTYGIPLITAKIIKDGFIQEPQEFIEVSYYDEWMRRGIPQKGDVIFTTEAPMGEVAILNTDEKVAFAQRVIIFQPKPNILHYSYLYYALKDNKLKGRIEAKATGTTVVGVKSAELKKVEIDLPPLPEQKAIAAVLSALDDKIELNNKINKKLEEMAQAIFKSWFVDFEPSQDNEIELGVLSDICNFSKNRIALSEISVNNYISTENMLAEKQGITIAANMPSACNVTAFLEGNTLVSNIRPYFKKIFYCDFEGGCSGDVLCFVPKSEELKEYLYCALYSDDFFNFMMSGSKGTKMPRGDKSQIMSYPVAFLAKQVSEFSTIIKPIFQKIGKMRKENNVLAALRDTLLPKLMSGEIRVPLEVE